LRARFPADRGVAGAVITTARSLRVDDVAMDPRFYPGVDQKTGFTTRSIIAAPLLGPHGPIGVVQGVNTRDGTRVRRRGPAAARVARGERDRRRSRTRGATTS
jgi:hypothetical protein